MHDTTVMHATELALLQDASLLYTVILYAYNCDTDTAYTIYKNFKHTLTSSGSASAVRPHTVHSPVILVLLLLLLLLSS
jgi:hypothetical protein